MTSSVPCRCHIYICGIYRHFQTSQLTANNWILSLITYSNCQWGSKRLWNQAEIIPVMKNRLKTLNDFSQSTLTSFWIKIWVSREDNIWPYAVCLQGPQRCWRYILTLPNLLFKHLERNKSHVRITLVDIPSAFNTIQPHILAMRPIEHFQLRWFI